MRAVGIGLGSILATALATARATAAERPAAATILRRAELVRNPYLGIAVEVDLAVASRQSGRELRRSQLTLLTHRHDRSLVLIHGTERAAPAALLIADDSYWLLLPDAARPVELALRHVLAGDLSHAGFLRVNLRVRYTARYDGDETLGDVPCWRLELRPKEATAPFARVRYWVAQHGFLPVRIDYYGAAEELLKSARFTSYLDTSLGRRPERIEIEDSRRRRERATLTLSRPQRVSTSKLRFSVDDLVVLRDAAQSFAGEGEARIRGAQLAEALEASARARAAAR